VATDVLLLDFANSLNPYQWAPLVTNVNTFPSAIPTDEEFAIAAAVVKGGPRDGYTYLLGHIKGDIFSKYATMGKVRTSQLLQGERRGG